MRALALKRALAAPEALNNTPRKLESGNRQPVPVGTLRGINQLGPGELTHPIDE